MSENPGTVELTATLEALLGNSAYCVVWLCYRLSALEGKPLRCPIVWINNSIQLSCAVFLLHKCVGMYVLGLLVYLISLEGCQGGR